MRISPALNSGTSMNALRSCNWNCHPSVWNRRQFLQMTGAGFAGLALQYLLDRDGLLAAEVNPLGSRQPHYAAKAKAVIFLFMYGGPSQVDLFDPKPALDKWHGKPIPVFKREDAFFPDTKPTAYRSPYTFKKYGQCGMDVSEKFPEIARC